MATHRPPRLRVSVTDVDGRPLRSTLGAWLAAAAPATARGTVAIALASDADVRRANRRYRGIDRATDVLSFPAQATPTGAATHLGEILIARGVAARQAVAHGHAAWVEWRVLALHGLLHLLGYDHEQDHGEMQALESRLRRRAGLPAGLTERP